MAIAIVSRYMYSRNPFKQVNGGCAACKKLKSASYVKIHISLSTTNKMIKCRFGTKCLRKNCRYTHPHGREIDSVSITVISPKKDGSVVVPIDDDLMPAAKSPQEPNDWSRCIDFLQYIRARTAMFPRVQNPIDNRGGDNPAEIQIDVAHLVNKESDMSRNVDDG